ncbi:transcription factor Spi-C [Gastrophryne carolinensis]
MGTLEDTVLQEPQGKNYLAQDIFGEAFEDALEVLQNNSSNEMMHINSPQNRFNFSMQNSQEGPVYYGVPFSTIPLKEDRKKLRLYEYLYKALYDPHMTHCIQWLDEANGIFQFVSKNKEKLAEIWGKKKGNRKIMTYQKMARALRNYSKTGEIMKVRRKLTYRFSDFIIQRLSVACWSGKEGMCYQYLQPGMEYWGSHHWQGSTSACNDNLFSQYY